MLRSPKPVLPWWGVVFAATSCRAGFGPRVVLEADPAEVTFGPVSYADDARPRAEAAVTNAGERAAT